MSDYKTSTMLKKATQRVNMFQRFRCHRCGARLTKKTVRYTPKENLVGYEPEFIPVCVEHVGG